MLIPLLIFSQGAVPAPPVAKPLKVVAMLEAELAGVGAGWTALTSLVRGGVTCDYGIVGASALDRIANAGTVTFDLDNGGRPGVPIGWTSPASSDRMPGFNLNIRMRFSLASNAGGTRYYKLLGSLAAAVPVLGKHGARYSACTVLDWWDDAATMAAPHLPAQANQRPDQLIATILAAIPKKPTTQTLETGTEAYPWALDGGTGQGLTVREWIQQICLSEYGYAYRKGDIVSGDQFVFENRHHRTTNPGIVFHLTEADILAMEAPGDRADMFATVRITVHPAQVDGSATTVLYSMQNATVFLAPGETNDSLFGPYRDPTSNDIIGGTGIVPPVGFVDYTMNTVPDGTGADMTNNFLVSASPTGLGVSFTVINNGVFGAYVTKLQVRGQAIRRTDAQVEQSVPTAYGSQILDIDMPFQSNVNVASALAQYLADTLSHPFVKIPLVTFLATKNAALLNAALSIEPGDRIAISETVSGIVDQPFTVNQVRLEVDLAGNCWCTWGLEQASAAKFWLLGFGQLGIDTIVGV